MATPYEVKQFVAGDVWTFAGLEECSFKDVDGDITLSTQDPRIAHVDPSAANLTIILGTPYKGYTFTAQNVTSSLNTITIHGGGKNINGNPDLTFSGAYAGRTVQYSDTLDAYVLIRSVN